MNILICRWDIFVYPDILDTMKNEGHLCDVLDFSAIKMSDEDIASFSKVLEDKLCEKNSDFYIANLSADNSPLKNYHLCHSLKKHQKKKQNMMLFFQ